MFGDNPFSLCLFGTLPDGTCVPDPPKANANAWYMSPYVGIGAIGVVTLILFLAFRGEKR